MIYPRKCSVLADCFFISSSGFAVEQPLAHEWRSSEIDECADRNDLNEDYITQLEADSILTTDEHEFCNLCGSAAENCEFPDDHDHNTRQVYRLQEEPLVEEWVNWIRDSDIFRTITDQERVQQGHWTVKADFKRSNISFQIFLDADLLREYDFRQKELEFGISFIPASLIPDEEYLFPWFEPLDMPPEGSERQFGRELDGLVEKYENAITARVVSEDAVEGFAREVRSGVWESLETLGFEPSTEISRCNGYRQYGIEPQDDDFVAIRQQDDVRTDFLFCRCSKGPNSIHFHLFEEGNIVSPEEDDSINRLIGTVGDKIDKFREIQNQQENINRFIQVVGILAAVVPALFIVNFIFDVVGVLQNIFPSSWETTTTLGILILINIVAVVILVLLIIYPYARLYRFSWGIKDESGR